MLVYLIGIVWLRIQILIANVEAVFTCVHIDYVVISLHVIILSLSQVYSADDNFSWFTGYPCFFPFFPLPDLGKKLFRRSK